MRQVWLSDYWVETSLRGCTTNSWQRAVRQRLTLERGNVECPRLLDASGDSNRALLSVCMADK